MPNTLSKLLYIVLVVVLIILVFKFTLWLLLIIFISAMLRNFHIARDSREKVFLMGKVPSAMPEGFYYGNAGFTSSWIGKKFDSVKSSGINVFNKNGTQTEGYVFKTFVGKALVNGNLDVIKISYDMPENPFWVRWIVDEIVEVAPDEYLGKMHLKILPGFPFSILFFSLKK